MRRDWVTPFLTELYLQVEPPSTIKPLKLKRQCSGGMGNKESVRQLLTYLGQGPKEFRCVLRRYITNDLGIGEQPSVRLRLD